MKITLVDYNNKSRQGTYVRVTKGKITRIFKYIPGTILDHYSRAFNKRWDWRKLHKMATKYPTQDVKGQEIRGRYLKSLKRTGRLSSQFSRGVTQVKVKLDRLGNTNAIKDVYTRLLSPLVADKGLLNIIIDSRHKLRHRFAYKIEVRGISKTKRRNVPFGYFSDVGNRIPEEIFNVYHTKHMYRIKNEVTQGQMIADGELLGLPKGAVRQEDYGKITDITVTVVFQRG